MCDIDDDGALESFIEPGESESAIAHAFAAMDGKTYYARYASRLPRPMRPEDVTAADRRKTEEKFIQVGGSADCLTIEARTAPGSDGIFTVGRSTGEDGGNASEARVRIGTTTKRVRADEVFQSAEAARIFKYYLDHDEIPPGYELRPLQISQA
ncbi:MAG: hypothetical protein PGN29_01195 [Gordonia paraffinivorans]